MLVGNGCWGPVTASGYQCNGPNEARHNFDMLYGKGLASKKQYQAVYKACGYANKTDLTASKKCKEATKEFNAEVGPFNVYNVYNLRLS